MGRDFNPHGLAHSGVRAALLTRAPERSDLTLTFSLMKALPPQPGLDNVTRPHPFKSGCFFLDLFQFVVHNGFSTEDLNGFWQNWNG